MTATLAVMASLIVTSGVDCSAIETGSVWPAPSAAVYSLGSTFAWMPAASAPPAEHEAADPQLRELVKEMVENGFAGKGYEKTNPAAADFWIGCRIDREVLGSASSNKAFEQYTQGTLAVYVVARNSNKVIWRGWAQARLKKSNPPENKRERLQAVIDRILHDFPSEGRPLRKGEH